MSSLLDKYGGDFMKQLSALEKKSLGKPLTDPPAVAQAKKSLLSILLKT